MLCTLRCRLTDYQQARIDAKQAYEREISHRIQEYTHRRQSAKLRADSTGCLVTLKPLNGRDYFQETEDENERNPSQDQYFDATECMEYLELSDGPMAMGGSGSRSGILTAPVYLDPNYVRKERERRRGQELPELSSSGPGGRDLRERSMTDSWDTSRLNLNSVSDLRTTETETPHDRDESHRKRGGDKRRTQEKGRG